MDNHQKESLNLKSFFELLWLEKKFIFIFSSTFVFLTIIYVLFVTPIYESTAIVIHNSEQSAKPQMSGALQQVASIVSADTSVSTEQKIAISRILSKDYFLRIYSNRVLLECLITDKSFCKKPLPDLTETIEDEKNSIFAKPSFMNAYKEFKKVCCFQ